MTRYFYGDSIENFLHARDDTILGQLASHHTQTFDLNGNQAKAWKEEISLLRTLLQPYAQRGGIFLEYSIPRMGRRIDAVVLIDGIVFVLEFKVYETQFERADFSQVWDYALDLKNFHEESHNRILVPILIATNAPDHPIEFIETFDDHVIEPLVANSNNLAKVFSQALATFKDRVSANSSDEFWAKSRYAPTPTIIEAACALYEQHTVDAISRTDASAKNLTDTCSFIDAIIDQAQKEKFKALCFVTGVPGAGKTLVGLNTATKHSDIEGKKAVYLSGNGPLVDVLVEALAANRVANKKELGEKMTKNDARQAVKSFIQNIHHYRDECLLGTKIINGEIVADDSYFKTSAHKRKSFAPFEHIAIFDEAQRAWTKEALANFMKRKKDRPDFPYSEPEYLISCLDRHKDWAVVICLVGGGQEINTGEAGISEWIDSVNRRYRNWRIFISDRLTDSEYAAGQTLKQLSPLPYVRTESSLHLAVSMRSFRAENLANFVHHLLALNPQKANEIYQTLDHYPIVLTRSLDKAKAWLKSHARGSERFGMIVSSQAQRLRPLAIDVRFKPNVVHWFLKDARDVRSSMFLEDVATEFDIQGLELDWTCVVWDGDLRYSPKGWTHHSFVSSKWQNINKKERQMYQTNAYRVLLTRARQGMVIVVPEGNPDDPTREPKFYDATYEYLKSIGIQLLD